MHTSQSHCPDLTPVPPKERKAAFSAFRSIIEGISKSRARSRLESLLARAPCLQGDERTIAVSDAAESFATLDEKHKAKVVSFIEKKLKYDSQNTFDYPERLQSVIATSSFISEISKQLPVDESGNKIAGSYERITSRLETIAESKKHFNPSSSGHMEARLSCTKALWDMDYGHIGFWENRLVDGVTSGFTIEMLLEMPKTKDPEAHGWALLRKHLPEIGSDIAVNPSTKRDVFLFEMLMHDSPVIAGQVFDALLRLERVPGQYVRFARAILKDDGKGEKIKEIAEKFLAQDKLRKACEKSQSIKAVDTEMPLSIFEPKAETISDIEIDFSDLYMVMVSADDRQFASALELIRRYRSGRRSIQPFLDGIADEMLDIIEDPAGWTHEGMAAQQQNAMEALTLLLPELHSKIASRLLDMPQKEGLGTWDLLASTFNNTCLDIVSGTSANKYDFILKMLESPDERTVRVALRASAYLDRIPVRVFMKANDLLRRQEVSDDAALLMEMAYHKEVYDASKTERFMSALTILDFYLAGNKHLGRMVEKIGAEMVDIYTKGSSGNKPEHAGALLVLAHMNAMGIRPNGLNLFDSKSIGHTVKSLLEMPDIHNLKSRGWNLMMQNISMLAVPVAESESPAKTDFIKGMLDSEDDAAVSVGLQMSVYLKDIPEGFISSAKSIAANEAFPGLAGFARTLLKVDSLKTDLESKEGSIHAVIELAPLFKEGSPHIGLMLMRKGKEMVADMTTYDDNLKAAATKAIAALAESGIEI